MNGFGKIRRCPDRNAAIIDFYLYLAAAIVAIRRLIQRARTLYRWDTDRQSTESGNAYCRSLLFVDDCRERVSAFSTTDRIVPFTVEIVRGEGNVRQFGINDLDADRVGTVQV
ncbi:hypothetical protein GA0070215_1321 [Micromonospora marina]|uniref:Uncharacterized protein n=1 Tax=Micromonospora marina TaxID=307120 RepID=A0A1C5AIU7_9ACTN|nr:hypothetical protein GA0070215_1321 [Micromonospora marina]